MSVSRRSLGSGSQAGVSPRVIGVVDIGTNSVKLVVGHASGGGVVTTHFSRETTRLGAGLAGSGRISTRAAARTARAVRRLIAAARAHGAHEVVAIGTFAFRSAENGRDVARAIARVARTPVRVLSGKEEATLALASVRARLERPKRYVFVIDVGGGSVEFVVARGAAVRVARSAPIGALRLTERHLHSDPIAPAEYLAMKREIDRTVARLFAGVASVSPGSVDLVASGGSATTALAMLHGGPVRAPRGYTRVSLAGLRRLEDVCARSTLAQRKRLRGLPSDRADIIPAGLAVIISFVRRARKRSLIVSDGGVREGVILSHSKSSSRSPRRNAARDRSTRAGRRDR